MSRCLTIDDFHSLSAGTLDPAGERELQDHLSDCSPCHDAYTRFMAEQTVPQLPRSHSTETRTATRKPASDSSPLVRVARNVPRIDGYQITGKLGQGGMGVVYRAVQTKLDRVVALKVLPAIVADGPAVERFRREAKSAARLHHTNIVPIYDFGESHDGHFYAMELIEGKPLNELIQSFATQNISSASQPQLAALLKQGTLGTDPASGERSRDGSGSISGSIATSSTGRGRAYYRQVARWMADAAEALHYAHGQGIIHRDIKPGNMILSSDGRLMITDFGLAKTQEDTSISVVGALVGAIRYLSPEQAMAGRIQLDHRTDIWSLGATLYELLTFVPAFPGTDEKQILSAIITKDPVSLRKLDAHVPAELETICLKALEKSPDHRYLTAQALAEDLHRWLNDVPIEAKRPGPIRRVAKFARRHKAITTAAAASIVLLFMSWVLMETNRVREVAHLREKAGRLERENNWVEAANQYREALKRAPNHASIMNNLARSLQEQYDRGNYDSALVSDALQYCDKAREIDPSLPNIDNTYAVLLSMAGRENEAIEILKKDIPNDGPAAVWCNIGAVHFLGADLVSARNAFQRAIDDPKAKFQMPDGTSEFHHYFHGYHELATLQLMQGDAAALKTIEDGIELQDSSGQRQHFSYFLVNARILLLHRDLLNPAKANAAALVARGLNPDKNHDRMAERYLAISQIRLREFDKARRSIERAATAKDLPVFVHLLTALVEAQSGNLAVARAALDRATENWPADLRTPGTTIRSRHMGMIWFESADELNGLNAEVLSLLK